MGVVDVLRQLLNAGKITEAQFDVYRRKAVRDDEIECVKELERCGLITNQAASETITAIMLGYTE